MTPTSSSIKIEYFSDEENSSIHELNTVYKNSVYEKITYDDLYSSLDDNAKMTFGIRQETEEPFVTQLDKTILSRRIVATYFFRRCPNPNQMVLIYVDKDHEIKCCHLNLFQKNKSIYFSITDGNIETIFNLYQDVAKVYVIVNNPELKNNLFDLFHFVDCTYLTYAPELYQIESIRTRDQVESELTDFSLLPNVIKKNNVTEKPSPIAISIKNHPAFLDCERKVAQEFLCGCSNGVFIIHHSEKKDFFEISYVKQSKNSVIECLEFQIIKNSIYYRGQQFFCLANVNVFKPEEGNSQSSLKDLSNQKIVEQNFLRQQIKGKGPIEKANGLLDFLKNNPLTNYYGNL